MTRGIQWEVHVAQQVSQEWFGASKQSGLADGDMAAFVKPVEYDIRNFDPMRLIDGGRQTAYTDAIRIDHSVPCSK